MAGRPPGFVASKESDECRIVNVRSSRYSKGKLEMRGNNERGEEEGGFAIFKGGTNKIETYNKVTGKTQGKRKRESRD